jgi:hypothetical protein
MFKLVQDHYIKYSRPLMYREEREELLGFSFLQRWNAMAMVNYVEFDHPGTIHPWTKEL